jgi:NAD(P)-dependent dehydrogenase (short-subunit alcohol dehydrogenase family)
MNRFPGNSVLVTGAGSGIGYAICRHFAQEGATVALNDINPDLAQQAAVTLNESLSQGRVIAYGGDVADVATTRNIVGDFASRTGRLDVVVANAGITVFGEFLKSEPDSFDQVMGVNLRGTYFTAQAGARIMVEKSISGRILLMSSVVGLRAMENMSVYSMTKAGISMMARSLALELGPYGITVNGISPGPTLTERTMQELPDYEASWSRIMPTRQIVTVDDIAATALFLASPEARQITGGTVTIDGGTTLRNPTPRDYT